MPTIEQKMKALISRMPEAAYCLKRITELAEAIRRGEAEPEAVPYIKDNYLALKVGLETLFTRLEEPATGELPTDQATLVLAMTSEVDRNLGSAADWAKKWLYGPSGHPNIVVPVAWTAEQKDQLKQNIAQAVQRAKDALEQMP